MFMNIFSLSNIFSAGILNGFCAVLLLPAVLEAASEQSGFFKYAPWIIAIVSAVTFILAFILGRVSIRFVKKAKDVTLDEAVNSAGYDYDAKQDTFYSVMNPWQREAGYCRLYDEAAAPLGMIIDCEPVYFEYKGKRWLIEFWKGQYDLTTGCEIGVYTDPVDLKIPGIFHGTFYKSAGDDELIYISCILYKNGKKLFKRSGRHWWLTGFVLGEFSQPSELTMEVTLTLLDSIMCDAFVESMIKAGYSRDRIARFGSTVSFVYDKPVTKQPYTRSEATDWIIQKKNKIMCDLYQEITQAYPDIKEKLLAFKEQEPELYRKAVNIGKSRQVFGWFDTIRQYLN